MEPIALSQEQKERLLEMCREFFMINDRLNITEDNFVDLGYDTPIHWFEFVMVNLVSKFLHGGQRYSYINEPQEDVILGLQDGGDNPIDTMHYYFSLIKGKTDVNTM